MSDASPTPERGGRYLFETALRRLSREQRILLARTAEAEKLEALCFDPDPGIIRAIFENPLVGLTHARLIAFHHRNPVGLDALGHQALLARDGQVQKRLLQNPQTSEPLLRRILHGKRLLELYPLTGSREGSERTRQLAREALRQRFGAAEPDQCVQLIVQTEGRCLGMLSGIPLGARAAAILCQRTLASTLLIQNLAQWAPAPPNVIEHLFRQPVVQRQAHLRTLLLRHPNCPPRLKAGG